MRSTAASGGAEPFTPHAAGEPERVAGFPALRLVALHRDSFTNVLVLGASSPQREAAARAFHRDSPVRQGPFMRVDCGRDVPALVHALGVWLDAVAEDPAANPLRGAERGTLYLDRLELLPLRAQRLLLTFVRRCQDSFLPGMPAAWTGRLVAGASWELVRATGRGSFLRSLFDCLDKVRVELDRPAW